MNRTGNIKKAIGDAPIYRRGVAEVCVDFDKLERLRASGLFDLAHIECEDGPTNGDFYNFLKKHKEAQVGLIIIDPIRDDFRIGVKSLYIAAECACINTDDDIKRWADFMAFTTKGNVVLQDTEEEVILLWD